MNIFDALDTYEIVNNGSGRRHFERSRSSTSDESRPSFDGIRFIFAAFRTKAEANRLAKEEGLTERW